MDFFTFKLSDPNATEFVDMIYTKEQDIEIKQLNQLSDNLIEGSYVFINLGGDRVSWEKGMIGLAEIVKPPYDLGYDESNSRNFKIRVKMDLVLDRPIKRDELIPYRDTYDAGGLGPATKGEQNQAIKRIEEKQAISIIRAMLDRQPRLESEIDSLFPEKFSAIVKGKIHMLIDKDIAYGECNENGTLIYSTNLNKEKNMTIEELGNVLSNWYNNPPYGDKSYTVHVFGIRYGQIITENKYKPEEIIEQAKKNSDIKDTSAYELRKGIKIYDNIKSGEYGLAFCEADEKKEFRESVSGYQAQNEMEYFTGYSSTFARNRIIFGAPGTGKSFKLNEEKDDLLKLGEEYERVTFHPDYSYANFVGTYKPVPTIDSEGKDVITYEYVPGPFMRVYVNALKSCRTNNVKPFLLIIEEINRANVAAVFGDVFQLLDRGENNVSEYPIQTSEDIKTYLATELGGDPDEYSKIRIPDNMFIWATMNSADQGVFPMDTAFKRRWDFTYLGINDNDGDIQGKYVFLADNKSQKVEWNKLRKAINDFLAKEKINEDKQLGPYFISRDIIVPKDGNEIDRDRFVSTFKNKVIMYLFEDAAKQKRLRLFEGCFQNGSRYSEICKEFEAKGVGIFNRDIQVECDVEDVKLATDSATE